MGEEVSVREREGKLFLILSLSEQQQKLFGKKFCWLFLFDKNKKQKKKAGKLSS